MIGLFDSGVGGLSVLRRLWSNLPEQDYLYFADSVHMPYGPRTPENIRNIVTAICDFLASNGCDAIIMACNTSSALALPKLRARYSIPIIGVLEPGARAAVNTTKNKKVGVLATDGTIKSGAYTQAVKILDSEITVYGQACPRLAPLVEHGYTKGTEVDGALWEYLSPLIECGIDTLVLGCTHYVFLAEAISRLLPKGVELVDPAVEAAKDMYVLMQEQALKDTGKTTFFVSGCVEDFKRVCSKIITCNADIHKVSFHNDSRGLKAELE